MGGVFCAHSGYSADNACGAYLAGLRHAFGGLNDALRGFNDAPGGPNDTLGAPNGALGGLNDALGVLNDALGGLNETPGLGFVEDASAAPSLLPRVFFFDSGVSGTFSGESAPSGFLGSWVPVLRQACSLAVVGFLVRARSLRVPGPVRPSVLSSGRSAPPGRILQLCYMLPWRQVHARAGKSQQRRGAQHNSELNSSHRWCEVTRTNGTANQRVAIKLHA